MKRIAVYCGSATPHDARFLALARDVGAALAARQIGLVYGGGTRGLMGAVAQGALDAGGEVIGVIPEALANIEMAHPGCTDLRVVPDMHTRKQAFVDLSDGFITLPGGVGTMDELWEAVSWSQLGYHAKPVGVLNAYGFYDGLLAFSQHLVDTGFVRPAHGEIIIAEPDLEPLLARMTTYVPHVPVFAMKAEDL